MARCYSGAMRQRQPLPPLCLLSDARNDAALERALADLPRGSLFVFRHTHLPEAARRQRFAALAALARRHGHLVVLSGSARQARRWGADGAYGSARQLGAGAALLRLVTVHSLRELRRARRADAVLLSPVFPTRSHPGARVLGPLRFCTIAAHARVPVIALGGMDRARARRLGHAHWAAIDGLVATKRLTGIPKDS